MKRGSKGVLSLVAIMVGMVWGSSLSHATTSFVHPGVLNNRAEYDLMKAKVAAQVEPWYTAYQQIPTYLSYTPQAVSTLSDETLTQFGTDGQVAYASALRWVAAGDAQHRDKAKQILNAWAYRLTSIGSDVLKPGYWTFNSSPDSFIYAAEIIKHTSSGWSSVDQSQFAAMVRLILPHLISTDTSSSNRWQKANPAAMATHVRMAAGVYLDDQDLFDQAVREARDMIRFYIGTHGNPLPTGFTYETCRYGGGNGPGDIGTLEGGDLNHTQYGLGPLVQAAEIAKKQGIDLYGYADPSDGASILTALRYHTPFILGNDQDWPCQIPLNQLNWWYHMPWQMAYNHYRDASIKTVVTHYDSLNYTHGPYAFVTTGASYEMLTHNYGSGGPIPTPTTGGAVAQVGPAQTAHTGASLTLDGTRSFDPTGHTLLRFDWTITEQPVGSTTALSGATSGLPSLALDVPGDYTVQLVVTDSLGAPSTPATTLVSTVNSAPIAAAGVDQVVSTPETMVQLDGRQSFDPDGDALSFAWALVKKPAASIAALSKATSPTPTFVMDVRGDYLVRLIVTDAFGAVSSPATMLVSSNNVPPVAVAASTQAVLVGTAVALDAHGSFDADGDRLTFSWSFVSKPDSSLAELDTSIPAAPTFVADEPGMYLISLVVHDGLVESQPSNVTILALAKPAPLNQTLGEAIAILNALDPAEFRNTGLQHTLTNKLIAVLDQTEHRRFQQALDNLEQDILAKVDGCANGVAPDQDDWLASCEAQALILPVINQAIELLETSP